MLPALVQGGHSLRPKTDQPLLWGETDPLKGSGYITSGVLSPPRSYSSPRASHLGAGGGSGLSFPLLPASTGDFSHLQITLQSQSLCPAQPPAPLLLRAQRASGDGTELFQDPSPPPFPTLPFNSHYSTLLEIPWSVITANSLETALEPRLRVHVCVAGRAHAATHLPGRADSWKRGKRPSFYSQAARRAGTRAAPLPGTGTRVFRRARSRAEPAGDDALRRERREREEDRGCCGVSALPSQRGRLPRGSATGHRTPKTSGK